MGCSKKNGAKGAQRETQLHKLDDDIIEIIIFNILSLIIVNGELDKKNFKNKIIDSIIINNINFILNNFFMFSFNNIQKLLFIIDMILNNEVIYYKFNKIIDISTLEWNNFSIATKISNLDNNADTNLISRERGSIATNKSRMSNNNNSHKNEKNNEDKKKKCITGKQYTYITDSHNINNVNNYIDDIFIYIEEKNTYLSIFHLNYIFKNNKEYEYYFKQKYENYLSFGKYYHNIIKLYKKKYQENDPLYIKKSKYIELYKSLIKYHISNYIIVDKNDKDYEQIISALYEKEYTSSSECYDYFDEKTNKTDKTNRYKNSMKYTKCFNCGNTINSSSNARTCNQTDCETVNCIDEKYIVYNIMNEEKIKKLYKYKTKKYKLIINNNFINKQSYISINIFPCNDIHIYNIKFQTLSTNVSIKSYLLILYTNMILFFNLLNSSLYLWVYKFISFLINILNNFNNTLYVYLDNSRILSQYNNHSHLKFDIKNTYNKYITSINNLENIKTESLKKIVQKYSKEDNKLNFNFPSNNYGYIQIYDKDKKGNAKKLVFHHFVQMQIFKYYATLCLIEIENFYQGILSCLLGDVYNKTIGKIGKFNIKYNYYGTVSIRNKHEKTINEPNFINNNIDLYLLIIETKNIMHNNNNNTKSENQIVNILTHLYFLILFNYINILVQHSIVDNMFIQNENNFKTMNNINEAISDNNGSHVAKDKCENNEKSKNGLYICNNKELIKIKSEIIELIDKKNIKLELLEFRKSEDIIEKTNEKINFNGSLITMPFYTNLNLLNYDFYYKKCSNPSSNNPNDVRNFMDIQPNGIINENANIQNCQKDKNKEENFFSNSITSLSPIFVNLVKEKIQNVFNQNFDLILHYNIYLPFYITTFADILKKYNYFLFENNSYYFCLGLSYLYILYDQVSIEIINEMCKKVLLVIKNNYYTEISKIIIINVFISFLNKKDVLNFCEQNINSYFPTLCDSTDLIITKYYFLLKLIRKKKISLNLLDIYIHLCTHKNNEVIKECPQQTNLLIENIQLCTDLLTIINPQTNLCDNEGLISLDTESDDSCNHSIADSPLFHISKLDTTNCSKLKNCTLNTKIKNNYKHKYVQENTNFEINFDKRWNMNFSHYSYDIESDEMPNFMGIKRKIPKKKRTNFSNIFGNCDEISEDNLSDISQNKKNVNMKKKYFLIFSYYIVKHYKKNTIIMNMLKSLVLNILLFNPDEINLLFFILYYLYKKKDIELFSFMENVILNCLSNLFNKKCKIIEFSEFLYYLVKIKHSNTIHILNMLSDVLKKYKFPIKVYIIIIKIIKVILQYHNINYNYKYLLSILEIIQNIQNNAYLYRVSTYYINAIENQVAFLENNYFKIQKNTLTNLTLEYDINKNNNISQINIFPKKKKNIIPEKYSKAYILSGYIKLIYYKHDRKNILNLCDNGSTIFYSQQNASNIVSNNKINSDTFSLEKYYNCNDFNSELFYKIYKDEEYSLTRYINYIMKNDHYIYLPLSLIYAHKHKHIYIKNCLGRNNSKIENKTISRHDLTHIKKKYKIKYKDKKLYFLNICFIHKPHFINMHNVYIPYIELGNDISEHNNRKFRKKNEKKCHIKGYNKNVSLLKIPNKRIIFTLQKRRKFVFFFYSKYSYMLCKSIAHEMNCSILNNIKNNERKKKQNILPNCQNDTCIEKGNKLLQETQSTKNRQMSEIIKKECIQKITNIYSKNFVNLKKDLVKKEIYKRKWHLKKYLLRLKKVYNIKKKSCKKEKPKKKIMNRYKLLIKIGVKLLINTTFYAYIIYLNKKKTFKKFLGEYNLKFTDFFLPFKAPTIYWKNIFENIWNGKFEKMYKTAKYFNITSDHALNVVNKKLYPFLIIEQPNIKNTKIYNKPKYNMHVEKAYALNDTYYAYNKKKANIQIKRDILDEFYIDNYSLNSSDTSIKPNKSNEQHFKNSDLNAKQMKHRKKNSFKLYKPILLYNTFYPGLNNLCNKTKKKEKEIINSDKKINNIIKIINKMKIHNNIYSLLKNRKTKFFNFIINDDNEIIMDKIIQRNLNKKKYTSNSKFKLNIDLYKKHVGLIDKKNYCFVLNKGNNNSKENTNDNAINKFIGIFLPPKHHLLMVFQIYDKSTIVKIRTDNLNVLNYLDPFFDEYFS